MMEEKNADRNGREEPCCLPVGCDKIFKKMKDHSDEQERDLYDTIWFGYQMGALTKKSIETWLSDLMSKDADRCVQAAASVGLVGAAIDDREIVERIAYTLDDALRGSCDERTACAFVKSLGRIATKSETAKNSLKWAMDNHPIETIKGVAKATFDAVKAKQNGSKKIETEPMKNIETNGWRGKLNEKIARRKTVAERLTNWKQRQGKDPGEEWLSEFSERFCLSVSVIATQYCVSRSGEIFPKLIKAFTKEHAKTMIKKFAVGSDKDGIPTISIKIIENIAIEIAIQEVRGMKELTFPDP